jgi:hypothetical protein
LVAWHGFWLLVAVPPVGIAIFVLSVTRLRTLGITLVAAGLLMLVGVGIWEAMTWLPKISPGEPTYMVRRYLFSVLTMTDLPTIPSMLSGVVLLISWQVKRRRLRMNALPSKTSPVTSLRRE